MMLLPRATVPRDVTRERGLEDLRERATVGPNHAGACVIDGGVRRRALPVLLVAGQQHGHGVRRCTDFSVIDR
jgi:hypothetical protein